MGRVRVRVRAVGRDTGVCALVVQAWVQVCWRVVRAWVWVWVWVWVVVWAAAGRVKGVICSSIREGRGAVAGGAGAGGMEG